jgi:hypothetical protein
MDLLTELLGVADTVIVKLHDLLKQDVVEMSHQIIRLQILI